MNCHVARRTLVRLRNVAVASLAFATILYGCATTPDRNPAVEDARARLSAAQSDPQVTSLAPLELNAAGQAFAQAEASWLGRDDPAEVAHRAYVARQRTAIAVETARQKAAEADITKASSERDRVRLQARTLEAEAAQRAAAEAQRRAQEAQMTAEQRRALAEEERRRAEQERLRAEQERLRAEEAQRQAAAAQQQATQSQQQAQDAAARARDLEAQMKELQATKTERGMVITLGDVLFDVGKADLKPGGMRTVERLAEFLRRYPQRRVAIEGFTDSTGSDAMNQALSERRAAAVRLVLMDMGIAPERSTSRGYGKTFPVASNDNAAGRQLNRRVEIVISDENGNIPPR